ncbi:MAG: 50S ribosomal protein L18 [Fusobacteria bacterium]|nr:50S ribosomal protein L18 [Fusobacteriota bacterium]
MINQINRKEIRAKKHRRIRNKISGTSEQPRLCVFRSLKHVHAQIIDDQAGHTLAAASSLEIKESGSNKDAASQVGKLIAEKAIQAGIKTVVFDRSGYIYHGRVQALAEGAREGGLEF